MILAPYWRPARWALIVITPVIDARILHFDLLFAYGLTITALMMGAALRNLGDLYQ